MWLASTTGEGNGTPLQYSCLENPMDRGAWWAAAHGVARSRTRPSDFTFTFHCHTLEKEMATHSSTLAWKIPWTGEPGGLPSKQSHRVGHNWSDLAAAASTNECLKWGQNSFLNTLLKQVHATGVEGEAWMKGTPKAASISWNPRCHQFKRLTEVKKTFQTFWKVTAVTLKSLPSGQKLAEAGEDAGITRKNRLQDLCQGHSQMFTLWWRGYEDTLSRLFSSSETNWYRKFLGWEYTNNSQHFFWILGPLAPVRQQAFPKVWNKAHGRVRTWLNLGWVGLTGGTEPDSQFKNLV